MNDQPSLQMTHGPNGRCFGCGPKNDKGLRIESYVEGDEMVCRWQGRPEHQAWEGMLNGGIVGALFDCHANWTAAWHLWTKAGGGEFPSTVTAEFHVRLKRPTPSKQPVTIRARVAESSENRATIEATMEADGELTATCRGTFVAIPPRPPAYHPRS